MSSSEKPETLEARKKVKTSHDYARFERKMRHIRQRCRSEIDIHEWGRYGYAMADFWIKAERDTLPRIDARRMDTATFAKLWEQPYLPCVILGVTGDWAAKRRWTRERLLQDFGERLFKVGEDDDGEAVRVKMKHYLRYLDDAGGAKCEDSPLYIFESSFSGTTKSEKKARGDRVDGEPAFIEKAAILEDYTVPPYFAEDLFRLTGSERRPPYRWFVMGPARSGTGIHLDPLGTSAWNTLLVGHKRWALFPPNTPKAVYDPPRRRGGDREGVSWFADVYPRLVRGEGGGRSLGERWGMLEVIQGPGETMFVPGGWPHVVMNLDFTIAITQNFCSAANLEMVWLHTRRSRPKLAQLLRRRITHLAKPEGCRADQAYWQGLRDRIGRLDMAPDVEPSSSSSSGSSSTSLSSGEGEDSCDCGPCAGRV